MSVPENPSAALVAPKREAAIGRLMTVLDQFETPEKRRIYAEWIVDALLDAMDERLTQGEPDV